MQRLFALGATLAIAACAQAAAATFQEADGIDRADVERIISVLASDDMRGREMFSEEAVRAAEFIAGEFRAAGLEDFDDSEGFLQRFSVAAYSMAPARAILDGRPLSPDRFQVHYGAPSIRWRTGDVPVVVVGPYDDPTLVLDVAASGSNALILVDDTHAEPFRTISTLFRRPTQYVTGSVAGTQVAALWNGTEQSTYDITANADVLERPLMNVVGQIPGRRADELVIFSAHYDHIGITRMVRGDSIANGADDDASGVAAVIELAKHFQAQGTPERTLLFVAFTGEEDENGGFFGSTYFSNRLDPDKVVAMLNIEMIGKPAVEGPNTAWITGFDRSSLGEILQAAVEGTRYEFYPDPYPRLSLFYRSDNRLLAARGVPAHSISTTPIAVDPHYHQPTDEIETLDLDHLTNTIRAIAAGAETIVSGRATPTRVEPLR